MFTIGDISRIVNISANTLRYYDEIGLFKPCLVQASNQYRYYSNSQIKELTFILELKQYGFSLDEIRLLLKDNSNESLKAMLEKKRIELRSEIMKLEDQYGLLEKRINKIDQDVGTKAKGCRVLIADDFELARKMIRNIIEEYGYTVVGEASTGEEAVAAYDLLNPELVIMDIVMPKMDGIDATVHIMQKDENARVIICSAMSQGQVILESIKAGAMDFISKPISSSRLIKALERRLDHKNSVNIERINNMLTADDNKFKEKMSTIALKQEEIDFLIYNSDNEQEVINKVFDKDEKLDIKIQEHSVTGPLPIELKILENLKDKFAELAQKFSIYLTSKFNSECSIKQLTVENITISELRTFLIAGSDIGVIKNNITSSPIKVILSECWGNNKEIMEGLLDLTAKGLKRINPDFNSIDMIIYSESKSILNERDSIILISFSIKRNDKDKGFVMLTLPHDLLEYL
ncbi:response regulator [Clostridium manihotivorum]|uniref:response regulator n=1 Tax=Clostridium manihotivorum TaxID=2320868 RepID=UPI000FE311E4|nr:response regulator [Clostridium manihotivorum]